MTHFKRATVYLALGKQKSALDDLNTVLAKKPDFSAARLQRGTILIKQGKLDEAHIDLEMVLRNDPYHVEANQLYTAIEPLKHQIQSAYLYMADSEYERAIDVLSHLLNEMPYDVKLREMRSQAFEQLGDLINAISDLRTVSKMTSDNTGGFLKLSKLHYVLGEPDESLTTIRECLKLDPDHKQCFGHYKKVKKLANQVKSIQEFSTQGQYQECVDKADMALKTESQVTKIVHLVTAKKCYCLNKGGFTDQAITVCTEALKLNNKDVNALCDRADAHINNENFDDGKFLFEHCHQVSNLTQHSLSLSLFSIK